MKYNCKNILKWTEAQLKYTHDVTLEKANAQELHDALGQQHGGTVLPVLPDGVLFIQLQLLQAVEHHGLHIVLSGKVIQFL